VEFGLLGPVRLAVDGRPIPVRPARQRAVLAVLLLHGNRVVSADHLIDGVWGERPPASARGLLHTYVWRLRGLLAGADPEQRILAVPSGYTLRAAAGELDLARFAELQRAGRWRQAQADQAGAARAYRSALALWRGEPAQDTLVHGGCLAELVELAEQRLTALEEAAAAELACGRDSEAIALLRPHVAVHRLRERPLGQLMLALYRTGRQAEALEAYLHGKDTLVESLGVDPGPELTALYGQILRADPALLGRAADRAGRACAAVPVMRGAAVGPAPRDPGAGQGRVFAAATAGGPAAVPRQLPAAVRLAGRAAELDLLSAVIDRAALAPGASVLAVVTGSPGVGKTALAVCWAHQVSDRYPDGQLFVNLHGFDHLLAPSSPGDALQALLRGLGVRGDQVPPDLAGREATYRSVLAGRRVLIVIDNARDASQVRPLVPAASGCAVVVTSRNPLTGLVSSHDAVHLRLDALTAAAGAELLALRLGRTRTDTDQAAVTRLVALCSGLPLALAITAAQAAVQPGLPLAALAGRLGSARSRLGALAAGELAADVEAAFSCSYDRASAAAQRMFRLLGGHWWSDIGAPAAASLAGLPAATADAALHELAAAGLLGEQIQARHGSHDLLREYAAGLAARQDGPARLSAARGRALDHYLFSACAAAVWVSRMTMGAPARPPAAGVTPEDFCGRDQAVHWLEAELPSLLASLDQQPGDEYVLGLTGALAYHLDCSGRWDHLAATQRAALGAAQRLGERPAAAWAQHFLGLALGRLGDFAAAESHLGQAIAGRASLADPRGQAASRLSLAHVLGVQGRHEQALEHSAAAHELFVAAGDEAGQALALNAIGLRHLQLGAYQAGLQDCEQALAMCQRTGHQHGEAEAWDSLGVAMHRLGQHERALECFACALDLNRRLVDPYAEADMLMHLGDLRAAMGDAGGARAAWQQALEIRARLRNPRATELRERLAGTAGQR
jgi:DNA-binding SARP family transcriptional activator